MEEYPHMFEDLQELKAIFPNAFKEE